MTNLKNLISSYDLPYQELQKARVMIIVSPGVFEVLLSSHGFLDQVRSCSSLFTNGGTDHYVHALPLLEIQKSHLDEQLIDEPCPSVINLRSNRLISMVYLV